MPLLLKIFYRVNKSSVYEYTEVQMRTETVSGVSDQRDLLTASHFLSLFDKDFAAMSVQSRQFASVTDLYTVSVA